MSCVETATSNWSAMFPEKCASSLSTSNLFMKKLVAVAVSNIAYIRAMFPEAAFGSRKIDDLDVKILSENNGYEEACQVVQWVKGCFEALDYKYLRQMMIGVHTEDNDYDNVIESYTFCFTYHNEGVTVDCNGEMIGKSDRNSLDLTKRSAVSLLRTILLLTNTLNPLPSRYFLTMKLNYYDDVTPADYEPIGFLAAEKDDYYFKGRPLNLRLGNVSTPFHSLKVRVKAEKLFFDISDEDAAPSESLQLQSSSGSLVDNEGAFDGKSSIGNEEFVESVPESSKFQSIKEKSKSIAGKENAGNNTVLCPCGSDDREELMVQCGACGSWQHGACFGILEDSKAVALHICDVCYKQDSSKVNPVKKAFYDLPSDKLKELCIWRRTLCYVRNLKIVQPSVLMKKLNIKRPVAMELLVKLENEGYVVPGIGKYKGRKCVDQSHIMRVGIPKVVTGTQKGFSHRKIISVDELGEQAEHLSIRNTPSDSNRELHGQKRSQDDFQAVGIDSSQGYSGAAKAKRRKTSSCVNGIPIKYDQPSI